MAPYQSSDAGGQANSKRELPVGYTNMANILAEKVPPGRLVSVMGLVKDYQVPIRTKGSDYKCTITLYDKSIEYELAGLAVAIFRHPKDIPVPTAGDVLVVTQAKVQLYRGNVSLITNTSTSLHIFSAVDIPRPPKSAQDALRSPLAARKLGEREFEYIAWLYHCIDKSCVADTTTFQKLVDQSSRIKDKFCTLENVVESKFCDVIVNVVKAPFDESGKTTLWVSDYTENEAFHKFSWDGAKMLGGGDGGSHGHLDNTRATAKWAGPFGKRSMQVTCFEPHASVVNTEVRIGQWIRILNLRIKFGGNGLNLEGVLHEDRDSNRRQIDILSWDDGEICDPRLKEAIRRKIEYEKLKKKQLKSFVENERNKSTDTKRKADVGDEPKTNSKIRRKEKRQAIAKKVEEQDMKAEERLSLNSLIKCESREQPITPVPSIIEPVSWKTTVQGEQMTLALPFVCAKYRTNVRVVDFRPAELENFATWRRNTESDVLSDFSSNDSDSGSDENHEASLACYSGNKIWEWRFALQLEDVDPEVKGARGRFWAVVDNVEAQQLTGLDACDLREDQDTLSALREQLFKLWGNLEETKSQEQQGRIANQRRVAANQPPPSSPTSTDNDHSRPGANDAENRNQNRMTLSNKPFSCCIRQYGVCVREPDPHRMDAGEGRRWVRMFGLFGTKISN